MRFKIFTLLVLFFTLATTWAYATPTQTVAAFDSDNGVGIGVRGNVTARIAAAERLQELRTAVVEKREAIQSAQESFREKVRAILNANEERKEALRRQAIRSYHDYSRVKLELLIKHKEELEARGITISSDLRNRLANLDQNKPDSNSDDANRMFRFGRKFREDWIKTWWEFKVKWSQESLIKLDALVNRAETYFNTIKDSNAYQRPNIQERVDKALERIGKYKQVIAELKSQDPDRTHPNKVWRIAKKIHQDLRVLHRWLLAYQTQQTTARANVDIDVILDLSTNDDLTPQATIEDTQQSDAEGFSELEESEESEES